MCEVNGVKLWASEYELLKELVNEVDADRDPRRVESWRDQDMNYETDQYLALMALARRGLVEVEVWSDTQAELEWVTQRGVDFVHTYEKHKADKARALKEQRLHDYRVTLVGGVAGLFSGALAGAFIPDLMRSGIAWLGSAST